MPILAALTLAACSSPLPDEHIAEVEQAWVFAQNNPACGATACPAGQVVTCGNVCVTPVALHGSCTQVDCQPTSVCAGHFSESCVDLMGNSVFTCEAPPFGKGILDACDPTKNECPADTYCKDNHTCWPSSSSASFCAVGVEEGYECDSDWTSVYNSTTNPKCAPCMPGTECIGGFCHQPCITTLMGADCPCGNFGEVNKCYTNPASGAHDCYECVALSAYCDPEHPCCATTQKCGGGNTCCKNVGQSCSTQAECCGNNQEVCLSSTNLCGACKTNTLACSVNTDCCSGLCTSGTCHSACVPGGPCTATGTGECANSTWTCDVSGQKVCNPKMAMTETCNGKDDDCNGKVDDIPSTACATPIATDLDACQSGFATGGHSACENGNTVCRAKAQLDYCVICGTDDNGANCGTCAASPCTPGVSKCTPDSSCTGSGTTTCVNHSSSCTNPTPQCWHPSDINTGTNCYTP